MELRVPRGADVITSTTLGFGSYDEREQAIKALHEDGWNSFVTYWDVQSRYALQIGVARWVDGLTNDMHGPVSRRKASVR